MIKFPVLLYFSLLLSIATAHGEGKANTIELEVQPGVESIRPLSKPAKLSLIVRDGSGKTVDRSRLQIRMFAPAPGLILSTDFPQVEGSPLLELEIPSSKGVAEWEYVFPIRGVYRLEVSAVDGTGQTVKRTFSLPIKETRAKLFYLGLFSAALFVFGFWVGRLFTPTSTSIASFFLWLGITGLATGPAVAQEPTKEPTSEHELFIQQEVSPPTVGRLSEIRWRLFNKKTNEPSPARLTLVITRLEKEKQIFALKQIPTDGTFAFKFNFFDGSLHQLTSKAEQRGKEPIQATTNVSVRGVEPSKAISLRSLALFLAVLFIGLITGRVTRKRKDRIHT
ncbi:MAG: hypothetical protein GTO40_27075 [Deltaproteobacteria bacterium]|nr:hypothetical protein [Deltaproteobacteria bacterium]